MTQIQKIQNMGIAVPRMAVPILLWGMIMRIKAYAKINLALDITGRREDGYHLLDMVMHTISLYDVLTLQQGDDGLSVTCGRTDVPCGEENTVYRAAEAFFREIGQRPNLSIEIEKRIPSQAGLAGGSADAAAALHALNRMYRAELPLETLCEIGLTVGADVPFCVWGGSARVQGIGERLERAPLLPGGWLVVCKPPVGVNTKEAYRLADAQGGSSASRHAAKVMEALSRGNLAEVGASLGNAFEDILQLPEVETIKAEMRGCGAQGACMTGSGSAVYGLFDREEPAVACKERLQGRYPETFVCLPISTPVDVLE